MSASTSGAFVARPESIWLMYFLCSLLQGHYTPLSCAGVFRQRTNEAVAGQLFHDVRRPAGDARHHEEGREHVDVEAHHVIGRTGGEIEVGMNLLLLLH